MENNGVFVFSGSSNPELAKKICSYLKLPLGGAKVTTFSDGEIQIEILENVRSRDVFVIQSTCAPVNDNLVELLLMIDAFKRASAGRITAVIPYFGYARQDRKDAGRVPISAPTRPSRVLNSAAMPSLSATSRASSRARVTRATPRASACWSRAAA